MTTPAKAAKHIRSTHSVLSKLDWRSTPWTPYLITDRQKKMMANDDHDLPPQIVFESATIGNREPYDDNNEDMAASKQFNSAQRRPSSLTLILYPIACLYLLAGIGFLLFGVILCTWMGRAPAFSGLFTSTDYWTNSIDAVPVGIRIYMNPSYIFRIT